VRGLAYPAYFKNDDVSQLKEGDEKKLVSTELFQSINPFFVVALTPLVIAFFSFLRSQAKRTNHSRKNLSGIICQRTINT
jgi:POT family proton-dependent oligopeptide transporter